MKTEDIALAHRVLAEQAKTLSVLIACHFEQAQTLGTDRIHWGYVGTAAKACEDLEALCDFLGLEVRK